MKAFLDENFLLNSTSAERLYHEFAAHLPIIDYHNHLSADQIAGDIQFENLTQVWLAGDHYKWRAMRANGIDEKYCTGNAPDDQKFLKWAETVPYTLRNPLYHWTHLELARYFNVEKLLNADSAEEIYSVCSAKLQTKDYSVKNLLAQRNVQLLCTTDDPADTLSAHQKIAADDDSLHVFPTFRPDQSMAAENPVVFNTYVGKLEAASNVNVNTYDAFLEVLKSRHDYFHSVGCRVSDHGLEYMYAASYTAAEIRQSFEQLRQGKSLDSEGLLKFKSALLAAFAEWNWEKGWVQQFHLGSIRNNNSRMLSTIGADAGADSIGDFPQAKGLSLFLNKMDSSNKLAKTILYNLNPADNEVFATMAGNFNDGSVAGKVQWGASWWFLDQKDGIEKQLTTLSNIGLVSRFVGMVTDSRSFLSFPRHEYFRRILCNAFGADMENGLLPHDFSLIGQTVQDICFNNARQYFNWDSLLKNAEKKTGATVNQNRNFPQ